MEVGVVKQMKSWGELAASCWWSHWGSAARGLLPAAVRDPLPVEKAFSGQKGLLGQYVAEVATDQGTTPSSNGPERSSPKPTLFGEEGEQ